MLFSPDWNIQSCIAFASSLFLWILDRAMIIQENSKGSDSELQLQMRWFKSGAWRLWLFSIGSWTTSQSGFFAPRQMVKLQPQICSLFMSARPHLAIGKAVTSALPLCLPSTKEKLFMSSCRLWSHQSKLVSFCQGHCDFNILNWNYYSFLSYSLDCKLHRDKRLSCILKSLASSASIPLCEEYVHIY